MSISFEKDYLDAILSTAADAAVKLIQEVDPNTVSSDDHRHFGNPFVAASRGDGTHYYCASEGQSPGKKWACRLFVSERQPAPPRGLSIRAK